ncbi:hypothetical protein HYH03_013447 [Edaphochlamys debaryana]|uniref:Phosphohistidine phosphatase n=1 Tax=Edaphochlamys debaryana TaxID=47281 RepID=A0A835XQX8_9CHLO|nr:hypothetical protein HYH03_013447 [Edaphochlamys debaryana]|eukprot:KAG2488010.1 hypothetical protein HYH03_013447 [Edaphochlamys debaryana]
MRTSLLARSGQRVAPAGRSRPSILAQARPGVHKPEPQSTVRRLILLRHADSDGAPEGVRDHDRPISALGRKQAASVASLLAARGWLPDLVLASNSRRTKQTLDEMQEVMQELADTDAHYYGSLYTVAALDGQTREHLTECLLEVADDRRTMCVMAVGHNKGWEEAASQLAGQAVKLRPASAALLQSAAAAGASWRDVMAEGAAWELVALLVPQPA